MTEDEMKKAQDEHRRMMEKVIGKGLDAHSELLAQILLARAEVGAAVDLLAAVIEHLPPEHQPTFEVSAEFLRLRKEQTDSLLISLENANPSVAAEIQRILDKHP